MTDAEVSEMAGVSAAGASPQALAKALLQIADVAGMPDSYWRTDSRVALAREVLGVPQDGRYTHSHLWGVSGDG